MIIFLNLELGLHLLGSVQGLGPSVDLLLGLIDQHLLLLAMQVLQK